MRIIYSEHAKKRMKQRGITEFEIEQVLISPSFVKKSFEGRKIVVGSVKNRIIKMVFIETENYIRVITVM